MYHRKCCCIPERSVHLKKCCCIPGSVAVFQEVLPYPRKCCCLPERDAIPKVLLYPRKCCYIQKSAVVFLKELPHRRKCCCISGSVAVSQEVLLYPRKCFCIACQFPSLLHGFLHESLPLRNSSSIQTDFPTRASCTCNIMQKPIHVKDKKNWELYRKCGNC